MKRLLVGFVVAVLSLAVFGCQSLEGMCETG